MTAPGKAAGLLERLAFGLLAGSVALAVLATGAARPQDLALVQALTALSLVSWLFSLWLQGSSRLFIPPVWWVVLLFAAYGAVWYSQAPLEYVARREVAYVLWLGLVFWLSLHTLKNQDCARWLVYVLAGVGLVVAAYGIFQFTTGWERVWHFTRPAQYAGRGSGTFICPNHFAAFLGMVFPLLLGRIVLARCGAAQRIVLAYVTLVLLAGIGVSVSRGAWVATAITLLLFAGVAFHHRGGRWIALSLLIVAGCGAYVLAQRSTIVRDRFSYERSYTTPHEMRSRLWIWQSAWDMWRDHPWIGVGPGHFDHRFPAYRVRLAQNRPGRVHNDYLNLLTDWGVVGAGLGLGALGLLAVGGMKTWRHVRRGANELGTASSDRAACVLGMGGGLTFAALHAGAEFNLYVPATGALMAMLAGGLAAQLRYATRRYWFRMHWPARLGITASSLLVVAALAVQALPLAREGRYLETAAARKHPADKLPWLHLALQVEPRNYETLFAIGECHRLISWEGNPGWDEEVQAAMRWFRAADLLNPYSPYHPLHLGMCLDWLGYHSLAEPWFKEAYRRDPMNYYVVALRGWHALQTGQFEEARSWFQRSLAIKVWPNPIATRHLRLVERKMQESP